MKQPAYMITSSDNGKWYYANAKTLSGAKREATSIFGAGPIDATIKVAEIIYDHGIESHIVETAKKNNHPKAKWEGCFC